MAVYSFYIFDRHTECIYTKHWLPTPDALPNTSTPPLSGPPAAVTTTTTTNGSGSRPGGAVSARNKGGPRGPGGGGGTSAADDAKLIFGAAFALRNMARKLGGDDDAFIGYRTAQYRLHWYETPSSLRLVMLTDAGVPSMRSVLHQIYINLWVEYVVKNPLSPVEHRGGEGVNNELFELGLDQFIRGLM